MNHSVRAAAMTKRNVLAPLIRCRLRHWSCPSPSKALLSRMAISTAQRWPYSRTTSAALKVRAVEKKASMAGGDCLCPGRLGVGAPGRRSTTTRTRRPGNTGGHRPSQAWISAPASLGGCPSRGGLGQGLGRADQVAFFARGAASLGRRLGRYQVKLGADRQAPDAVERLGQLTAVVLRG